MRVKVLIFGQSMMSKVAIIGAGPAGLMAAIEASKNSNNQVIIFERNKIAGKKLLLTGNGRCNLTSNLITDEMITRYYSKGSFLYSAFHQFSNYDLMDLMEANGVMLKSEENKIYPQSNKADDVRKALLAQLEKSNIRIRYSCHVQSIEYDGNFLVNDETFDYVVLATGGITHQATGSDGGGYKIAKFFGHDIVKPKPILGSLITNPFSDLQGLTLDVESIEYSIDNKLMKSDKGPVLFTHFGLSGPPIINLSYYATCSGEKHVLNLKIFHQERLREKLNDLIKTESVKSFHNIINQIIPKRLATFLIFDEILNKQSAHISNQEKEQVINLLTDWPIEIEGLYDYDKAMGTKGGVALEEIDPKTMMSKKVNNLYFAGEIIDLVGETGGYNLQQAFSTGFVVGKNIACKRERA